MKKFLERMWAAFTTYQERRARYIMLNHLTARQLQDMGLDREEFNKRFGI
jgi:uncharacterized protein YjiS (DUF1127 family)